MFPRQGQGRRALLAADYHRVFILADFQSPLFAVDCRLRAHPLRQLVCAFAFHPRNRPRKEHPPQRIPQRPKDFTRACEQEPAPCHRRVRPDTCRIRLRRLQDVPAFKPRGPRYGFRMHRSPRRGHRPFRQFAQPQLGPGERLPPPTHHPAGRPLRCSRPARPDATNRQGRDVADSLCALALAIGFYIFTAIVLFRSKKAK